MGSVHSRRVLKMNSNSSPSNCSFLASPPPLSYSVGDYMRLIPASNLSSCSVGRPFRTFGSLEVNPRDTPSPSVPEVEIKIDMDGGFRPLPVSMLFALVATWTI